MRDLKQARSIGNELARSIDGDPKRGEPLLKLLSDNDLDRADLLSELSFPGPQPTLQQLATLRAQHPENLRLVCCAALDQMLLSVLSPDNPDSMAAQIKPSTRFELQVTDSDTKTTVSFVMPKGLTPRDVLDQIEAQHSAGLNPELRKEICVVKPDNAVLRMPELDIVQQATLRYSVTIWKDPKMLSDDQWSAYLLEHGLIIAPTWQVLIAAALYRDLHGFPSDLEEVGTDCDPGDLFEARQVITTDYDLFTDSTGIRSEGFDCGAHLHEQTLASCPIESAQTG